MARQYSTKDFFRNTPNALLARYFAARGVLPDFDFKALKETKIDALFEAWLALPDAQRASMDAELREICEMSSDKGAKAIIDEAEFHLSEDGAHAAFVAMLTALPGHHERAMTTFLDYPALWKGATRFYHADTLSHWRKRKNLPKVMGGRAGGSERPLGIRLALIVQFESISLLTKLQQGQCNVYSFWNAVTTFRFGPHLSRASRIETASFGSGNR